MYLHKANRELFSDVVTLVFERMGVAADIVEKDYYDSALDYETVKNFYLKFT